MKRRNFLKSIIGAASAIAVPSIALAKQAEQLTFKGVPVLYRFGEASTETSGNTSVFHKPDILRLEYSWLGFGTLVLKRKYEYGGNIVIKDKYKTQILTDTIKNTHVAIPVDIGSTKIIIQRGYGNKKIIDLGKIHGDNNSIGKSFVMINDINILDDA